jgi:hypothetical protein
MESSAVPHRNKQRETDMPAKTSDINHNSVIIYRGPSQIDGSPIVVIASGFDNASANSKTGNMIQTWILADNGVEPHIAIKDGSASSICGKCRHQGEWNGKKWTTKRTCYVQVHNAPLSVFRAYKRNRYQTITDDAGLCSLGANQKLRLGAYGDPMAVPYHIWESLTRLSSDVVTGYTHQWQTAGHNSRALWQRLVMASVDTSAERDEAQAQGWRTFGVIPTDVAIPKDAILCPASEQGGRKTNCASCNLCSGTRSKARKSVVIPVHGSGTNAFNLAA